MINIALIGTWHVHFNGYAREIRNDGRCRIAALWDPDTEKGKAAAAQYACDFVADYDALLAREDVDAVLVCTSTDLHKEVKHIFTEKVLCFTEKDALEVAEAVERSGVKFCISFPWRCRSDFKWVKQAVEEGLIGKVNYCRMRNAHGGASSHWLPDTFYDPKTCGGGAMMDLGAHGMYILYWLMGRPVSASAAFTHVMVDSVEDNAVAVFTYQDGAIGVNETAFVAESSPFSFEMAGDKGTILLGGFLNKACYNVGEGWVFPRMPQADPGPIPSWLTAIENDTETPFGVDDAVALSLMMEMAYRQS